MRLGVVVLLRSPLQGERAFFEATAKEIYTEESNSSYTLMHHLWGTNLRYYTNRSL